MTNLETQAQQNPAQVPVTGVVTGVVTAAEQRPVLCAQGHVLIVTSSYPPHASGSSVIMRNLLSGFDPQSYSVVTESLQGKRGIEDTTGADVHRLMPPLRFSEKLNKLWRDIQLPLAAKQIAQLCRHHDSKVIIGVYPDFHFLHAARVAARDTKTPFLAYFHDTLAESRAHSRLAQRAATLQDQVFNEASRVLVMSRGMADLYSHKYDLACRPLEHTYLEPIPDTPPTDEPLRQAFWGGAIYRINAHSVARIAEALEPVDCPLLVASNTSKEWLAQVGVKGDHIKLDFFSQREAYLQALRSQGILLLALDWPDESPYHEDELATIFPTKTPEYLASGRPILVHCPEHYFLARFFREHGCGTVISQRAVEPLREAARELLGNSTDVVTRQRAALTAAHLFSAPRIRGIFQEEISKTAAANWGQRII